ncbi:MAG TPA: hypothetical protein VG367_17175 [Mucilaginibacter sp.]|jgi:hypothetical protein|nr:hypothetical protein [Mucilaginibacter sp.]
MEVHHHPEVEKKGFKEYILEGLMIFLAVLMGFIAENIREGITENKRAAEFARSYYGDIKKDTLLLHKAMRFNLHKIAAIDSAIKALDNSGSPRADTIEVYKGMVASQVLPFEPSSGNYEQIKSSGAIRNFKQKMIDLMNEYDLQARQVVRREDITQKFVTEQYLPVVMTKVNMQVSWDIITKNKIEHAIYLDRSDGYKRQYISLVIMVKIFAFRSMQEYERLLKEADKVMAELKKEYDLEE